MNNLDKQIVYGMMTVRNQIDYSMQQTTKSIATQMWELDQTIMRNEIIRSIQNSCHGVIPMPTQFDFIPLHGPLATSTDAFKDCTQAKAGVSTAELLNALNVPMKDVRREYCTLYADNVPYVTVEKPQGVSLNKADYGIPGYSKDELTKCCCEQVKDPQPIKRDKKSVAATINDWIFGGPNYRLSLVITAAFCFAFQLSPMYTTQPLIFKIPYKIACGIVLYRQAKKMVEMEEIYENEKKNDS